MFFPLKLLTIQETLTEKCLNLTVGGPPHYSQSARQTPSPENSIAFPCMGASTNFVLGLKAK